MTYSQYCSSWSGHYLSQSQRSSCSCSVMRRILSLCTSFEQRRILPSAKSPRHLHRLEVGAKGPPTERRRRSKRSKCFCAHARHHSPLWNNLSAFNLFNVWPRMDDDDFRGPPCEWQLNCTHLWKSTPPGDGSPTSCTCTLQSCLFGLKGFQYTF